MQYHCLVQEFLSFVAGFLAAFLGSMTGGGAGFIPVALLLSFGFTPKAAIATNAFGDLGFFPLAIANFQKGKYIQRDAIPTILVISAVGTLIGTLLIIYVAETLFDVPVSYTHLTLPTILRV